ncbi:MAG: DUF4180 domain-containing protein [Thermomicrobiales bacterium]
MAELVELGSEWVLRCDADGPPIDSDRAAADLIGDALSEGAIWVALPISRLTADFFQLRTGIAGMISQKFMNYRRKLAIVGDIAAQLAASNALRDWVRECNRGHELWFVASFEELAAKLGAANSAPSGK